MSQIPDIRELERTHSVTFWRLVELEPRLELLLIQARQAGVACRSLADVSRAFAPLRNRLTALIGFSGQHSRHRILGSVGAYEVAYWTLYRCLTDLLPGKGGLEAKPAGTDRTMPGEVRDAGPELARVEITPDSQPSQAAPTPGPLTVTITDLAQGSVVRLEGSASFNNLDRLQFALIRLIARRTPLAVLDLSELTFITSLAMGVLVTFQRDVGRWGGRVRIAGARPEIHEVLQVAGLTEVFEFCTTVEEATTIGS
jgi:anti-sigma B factor antagonist